MTGFVITAVARFIGRKLDGYKTLIGGVGFILVGVLGLVRIVFPDLTHFPDMTIEEVITSISAGMAAIGLGGKMEKIKNKKEVAENEKIDN